MINTFSAFSAFSEFGVFNNDILLMSIFSIIIIFVIPQVWRESNSWWFAIIKFWFGILPFMIGAGGIFVVFMGPIYAIIGLVNHDYILVTILYIYLFLLGVLITIIKKKNGDILSKI